MTCIASSKNQTTILYHHAVWIHANVEYITMGYIGNFIGSLFFILFSWIHQLSNTTSFHDLI